MRFARDRRIAALGDVENTVRSTACRFAASIPGATRIVAAPIRISIMPEASGSRNRRVLGPPVFFGHRRKSRPALVGFTQRMPTRLPSTSEQLLRLSPERRAIGVALGDNLRTLQRPGAAPYRPGKHFGPVHRLRLRFVQKLSVRHVIIDARARLVFERSSNTAQVMNVR
jgi:hypothetical protein